MAGVTLYTYHLRCDISKHDRYFVGRLLIIDQQFLNIRETLIDCMFIEKLLRLITLIVQKHACFFVCMA